MLSDEERKAFDYLQLCYDLSTITNESLSKLGIVLNLIEKQSKEIEEYKKQLDLDNECEIALNNKVMDLEKENEKLNKLHIQDNKHLDFIMKHSVSVQKIKDKIEYLKDYIEENSDEQGYWGNINPDVIYGQIEILEEILKGSEE